MKQTFLVLGLAALAASSGARAVAQDAQARAGDLTFLLETLEKTHPDAHWKHPSAEWTRKSDALRAKLGQLSDAEFFCELSRLVALLEDGHSVLIPAPQGLGGRSFPIDFDLYDDGLYVAAADPLYAAAVGKRVVSLGGRSVDDVLRDARGLIGADNEQGARTLLELVLTCAPIYAVLHCSESDGDVRLQTADASGDRTELRLRFPEPGPMLALGPRPASWVAAAPPRPPLRAQDDARPYWFEVLVEHAALYVRLNRIEHADDEHFGPFCNRLFKALDEHPALERLVVDLRGNRGGNNYIVQPLIHGVIKSRLDEPGRLFVLTDAKTFSAAVNTVSYFERETWALFAGAPAGGRPNHFGDAQQFELPNSKHLLLCSTVRWQDSDPRDVRPWTYPDLPVTTSFRDFAEGRDPVLDAVWAYKLAPIEGFTGVLPRAHWQRANQRDVWPPK